MLKFKDEDGNFVTPQKGDYVLASDIDSDDMHYEVSASFVEQGCKEYSQYGLWEDMNEDSALVWSSYFGHLKVDTPIIGHRRIIPTQQTLFEAAEDAPDGTMFKVGQVHMEKIQDGTFWGLHYDHGENVRSCFLGRTDYEIVHRGPRKRKLVVCNISAEVPDNMKEICAKSFDLIGRLCMWEGAHIGEPGEIPGRFVGDPLGSMASMYCEFPGPCDVTFQTKEQCLAAWKAECPELFK
jgi:hypothetical protein